MRWMPHGRRSLAVLVAAALTISACNQVAGVNTSTDTEAPATTERRDPVAAAEAQVEAAEAGVTEAQDALTVAGEQFCSEATGYVEALDRYGMLFTDEVATVGDVTTAGADLVEPASQSRLLPMASAKPRPASDPRVVRLSTSRAAVNHQRGT